MDIGARCPPVYETPCDRGGDLAVGLLLSCSQPDARLSCLADAAVRLLPACAASSYLLETV